MGKGSHPAARPAGGHQQQVAGRGDGPDGAHGQSRPPSQMAVRRVDGGDGAVVQSHVDRAGGDQGRRRRDERGQLVVPDVLARGRVEPVDPPDVVQRVHAVGGRRERRYRTERASHRVRPDDPPGRRFERPDHVVVEPRVGPVALDGHRGEAESDVGGRVGPARPAGAGVERRQAGPTRPRLLAGHEDEPGAHGRRPEHGAPRAHLPP